MPTTPAIARQDAPGTPTTATPAGGADVPLQAKLAWLSDPAAYPGRPANVECIQTHFAYIFLTPNHAYKLKRPIRAYGVDFRLAAERERCCREELRLNRRLATETYVAVKTLTAIDGHVEFDGRGEAVDWVVVMNRLDGREMLDVRLLDRRVSSADVERIVARLGALDHQPSADRQPMTAATYLPVLERRVEEALDTIARRAPGTDGGALATALHGCYSTVKPLLEARAWRARDGHGDLRAEHVWIGTPVQVIDALEFDAQLRLMDPLEDLAMLAVDAEHAGSSWLVPALRQAYETSTSDHVPNAIWLFYLALRAATRAKVALWRIEEPEAGDPRRWRAKVEEFLALGLRYLDAD